MSNLQSCLKSPCPTRVKLKPMTADDFCVLMCHNSMERQKKCFQAKEPPVLTNVVWHCHCRQICTFYYCFYFISYYVSFQRISIPLPQYRFYGLKPPSPLIHTHTHPSRNCSLAWYFPSKRFWLLNTPHLGISNGLPWDGFGNFLEPHKFCVCSESPRSNQRLVCFEKSQDFRFYNLSWQAWFFKIETLLFSVAGIPLSASILTTGIVCTFYTSLVSMAKETSHP